MTSIFLGSELYRMKADGPALTAAAAASCLNSGDKYVLPAGYFDRVGKGLDVYMSGRISSVITTPGTARFDIRLNGNVVWDSLAILLDSVAAHTNVHWRLKLRLTARSVGGGTSATLLGDGEFLSEDILGAPATAPKGSLTALLPWNAAPAVGAGFDSTPGLPFDVFFTQTVATGSLTVHQLILHEPN
jgi:hypothetical protein